MSLVHFAAYQGRTVSEGGGEPQQPGIGYSPYFVFPFWVDFDAVSEDDAALRISLHNGVSQRGARNVSVTRIEDTYPFAVSHLDGLVHSIIHASVGRTVPVRKLIFKTANYVGGTIG